jgi:SulP family sulfate permease
MTTAAAIAPSWAVRTFGTWVEQVSRLTLRADLVAGLLGALLVLPQGIAFATLAGLPPEYGLYTAVIPCAVAALFGSSWHVMSGPTNANSLALFAMLAPLAIPGSPVYIDLALTVTILVGLLQLAVGVLRLGSLANFISPAALLGFTGGAAALIAIHALRDLFGFGSEAGHGTGELLRFVATHLSQIHPGALLVGVVTLVVAVAVRRFNRDWPFMLIGLIAGAVVALVLSRYGAAWSVSLLGAIPSPLPPLRVPDVDWSRLPELLGLSVALSIVALGQSISVAKTVAVRSGQRIDPNREFVGQGLSNVVGGFFSSYVSCGSLNRSLPNLEAGARTPLASVCAALWLVALVAISASLLAYIPMAAIAGLLVLVAWNLLDVRRWRRMARINRTEFAIAAATFVATVAIRIELAILLGTILSLVSYLHRTSRPAMRTMGFDTMAADRPFVVVDDAAQALPECPQLKLLRMEGSIYFGATQHVGDRLHALRQGPTAPKHLLVMAKSMNFIDIAGAELWQDELARRRAEGGDLYFHRPRPQVIEMWERTGFIDALGRDHIFPDKRSAIHTIFDKLDRNICSTCHVRVFWECQSLPPPLKDSDGARG